MVQIVSCFGEKCKYLDEMAPNKIPTRYAHADGHTDLCYSEDGKYMITCGSDGDARIWNGIEDDDPFSTVVGERAIAVAIKGDHFYIGNDNNHVQAYSLKGKSRDGIITRFTAPVTHIAVSKDGRTIVSGSCDMTIHVTDKETLKDKILNGHKGPILGVAIDPKEKYLASSSCDGSLNVWSLSEEVVIKSWINVTEPTNDFFAAKTLGRADWCPEGGSYLAFPCYKKEGPAERFLVLLVERESWTTLISLSDECITKPISIALFSPCGEYLAASTLEGHLVVWNVNAAKTVMKDKHAESLTMTAIAWNPLENGEIAFCDVQGQLGMFKNCVPEPLERHNHLEVNLDLDDKPTESLNLSGMEDEDDENVISLEKIKAQVGFGSKIIDAEISSVTGTEDEINDERQNLAVLHGLQNFSRPQEPFQPTSTPTHLQQRFMVWNSVGIVRCYNTEEENSIDVEFNDSSVHHPIHMPNYQKHSMATLTEEVLVLACEADEDSPSKVVCVLLNSWDGSKEWNVDLQDGEEAKGVAAGRGWLAVATNTNSVRFFTIGGCQREVMSYAGPVVCVAGHENYFVLVFHNGVGVNGYQNLFFQLVVVGGLSGTAAELQALSPQPLPLSIKTTLSWIGFTDEGSLAAQDSSGVLRIFFTSKSPNRIERCKNGTWIPVCCTNQNLKSMHDHYFVLGVSEKYQNVRCVLCRGSHYPQTIPRPSVVEIVMQLPVCEPQTEKSQLEEKFWRSQLLVGNMDVLDAIDLFANEKEDLERTLQETMLKLFALACRSDLDSRAVELCRMMPSSKVAILAEKYATKLGKNHLADKINSVVTQKRGEEERRELQQINENRSYSRHVNSPLLFNSDENGYDTPSTPYDFINSPNCSGDSDNSILMLAKQKSKVANIVIKPTIKSDQNPFRKATLSGSKKDKGLSCFSTPNNPKPKVLKPSPAVEMLPKVKQSKLIGEKSAEKENKKEKVKEVTFMQWFSQEKECLVNEFPDLDFKALTTIGMQRYKEYKATLEDSGLSLLVKQDAEESVLGKELPETDTSLAEKSGKKDLEEDASNLVMEDEISENLSNGNGIQTKRKIMENSSKTSSSKKPKVEASISKLSAFMFKK